MKHPIFKLDATIIGDITLFDILKRFKNEDIGNRVTQNKIFDFFENYQQRTSSFQLNNNNMKHISNFNMQLVVIQKIFESGLFYLNVIDELDINFSKKTLDSLIISDMKFIVDAGSYKVNNRMNHFSFSMVDTKEAGETLALSNIFENEDMTSMSIMPILKGKSLKNLLVYVAAEDHENIYSFISLMMYLSTFEKDRERVIKKTESINKKVMKNYSNRKPIFSYIKLKQPLVKDEGPTGRVNRNYTSRWIVIGHWRNQYYSSTKEFKPKWIDSHWKGKDTDQIKEKAYQLKLKGEK